MKNYVSTYQNDNGDIEYAFDFGAYREAKIKAASRRKFWSEFIAGFSYSAIIIQFLFFCFFVI